jgi:hypothetical protein
MFKGAVFWIAVGGAIWWGTQTPEGRRVVADIMSQLNSSMSGDISSFTCDDISREIKSLEIQNSFGARFGIVKVFDAVERSKTADKVSCRAMITYSNNTTVLSEIWVEKNQASGELIVGVQQLF